MMIKYIYLVFLVFSSFYLQGQTLNNNHINKVDSGKLKSDVNKKSGTKPFKLIDKSEKFLWLENRYSQKVKDSIKAIIINRKLCKILSEPEIAALGYVATYIGSECNWDGECNEDSSNLNCKVLTALNLGYQCSEKHLGFLRKWFKNDNKILEELKNDCNAQSCYDGVQDSFKEIILEVKGNDISIHVSAYGSDIHSNQSWSWSETYYFQFDRDNIKLIERINH